MTDEDGLSPDDFSIEGARAAASRDELAEWVARFLASPGSDNPILAQMLADPPRSWLGPVQLPLDQLNRLAGPPDHPVLCPVDDDEWRDDVQELAEEIEGGAVEPPPIVVTFKDEQLVVEDGNHRLEALRRAGEEQAWAVVAFDDDAARDHFVERTAAAR
ncbi:MAG TPA: ParB/Srx family N-terminal domain-containing protein [Aquihabitans sp.]|jgi:hypothetical protein|nr:ParB/Srx family N-terminal domain-containing protein [Aquihabitans sp.]